MQAITTVLHKTTNRNLTFSTTVANKQLLAVHLHKVLLEQLERFKKPRLSVHALWIWAIEFT